LLPSYILSYFYLSEKTRKKATVTKLNIQSVQWTKDCDGKL
jgi:hypothetical protein